MSLLIIRLLMWLWWLFLALGSVCEAIYAPRGQLAVTMGGAWSDLYLVAFFVIPFVFCAGLRYLVARIRNPWMVLLPFFLGVLCANQAGALGIFLLPAYFTAFQVLSAVLLLAYFPPLCL